MSHATRPTRRPTTAPISSAARSTSAAVRAQIVTSTPSRASASAHPRPRPLLAAQTSARLPAMPRSISAPSGRVSDPAAPNRSPSRSRPRNRRPRPGKWALPCRWSSMKPNPHRARSPLPGPARNRRIRTRVPRRRPASPCARSCRATVRWRRSRIRPPRTAGAPTRPTIPKNVIDHEQRRRDGEPDRGDAVVPRGPRRQKTRPRRCPRRLPSSKRRHGRGCERERHVERGIERCRRERLQVRSPRSWRRRSRRSKGESPAGGTA